MSVLPNFVFLNLAAMPDLPPAVASWRDQIERLSEHEAISGASSVKVMPTDCVRAQRLVGPGRTRTCNQTVMSGRL